MYGFHGDDLVTADQALSKLAELTDSTTTESVRIFAAHLMDGMTPANALWFDLDVGDESDAEKRYLSKVARFLWENIHNSNFDSVGYESIIDAIVAGWFVMYVEEAEGGGFHFSQWPINECFVASSKPGARIDSIYRKFKLTAEQAVSEYGKENVSKDIRNAIAKGKGQEKFEFIHAIYPRELYAVGAKLAKNLPFESIHVECKSKKVLREGGYHEFPCVVPRWMLIPGSAYAVGPVFDALPDAATINKLKEMEFANLDMAVAGMWIAEDDGVLNPRSITIGARKVIVANSIDSMKELRSSADFRVSFMAEDRIQAQIRKILMADVLPPLEDNGRTATEFHIRMQWLRQMLGPVFGRLQSEYLQPLIERCFGIAFRAGVLGNPPQSLRGRKFNVKYVSPLARAQKMTEVSAIDNYYAGIVEAAQIDPDVIDNIDTDKATRFRGEALGVPADIIPPMDEVKKRRAARQQAQQQAQAQEIALNAADEAATTAARQVAGGS